MRTRDTITKQLRRLREQQLGTQYRGGTDYWRGVKAALYWVLEQDEEPDTTWLA